MDNTLKVFTARFASRDPDRFDITRKSGGAAGTPFAPSWPLLRSVKSAIAETQRQASTARAVWQRSTAESMPADLIASIQEMLDAPWNAYVPAYLAEMRVSYRESRAAWDALLARQRVVLVCYCTDATRCHRTLLAEILRILGATVRGEMP